MLFVEIRKWLFSEYLLLTKIPFLFFQYSSLKMALTANTFIYSTQAKDFTLEENITINLNSKYNRKSVTDLERDITFYMEPEVS